MLSYYKNFGKRKKYVQKRYRFYLLLLILMAGSCINKNTDTGCIGNTMLNKLWNNIAKHSSSIKLNAVPVSSTQIDLSWDDISNKKDFKIERSENGIDFVEISNALPINNSYSDEGLNSGKTYWYRVAYNDKGNQVYSNVSSITLPWTKTYAGEEKQHY